MPLFRLPLTSSSALAQDIIGLQINTLIKFRNNGTNFCHFPPPTVNLKHVGAMSTQHLRVFALATPKVGWVGGWLGALPCTGPVLLRALQNPGTWQGAPFSRVGRVGSCSVTLLRSHPGPVWEGPSKVCTPYCRHQGDVRLPHGTCTTETSWTLHPSPPSMSLCVYVCISTCVHIQTYTYVDVMEERLVPSILRGEGEQREH